MHLTFIYCFIFILSFLFSCTNSKSSTPEKVESASSSTNNGKPQSQNVLTVNTTRILNDFASWYAYHYNNIHLAQTFVGLDAAAKEIDKHAFLTALSKDNTIALHTKTIDNVPVYQLYKPNVVNPEIAATSKQLAEIELLNFNMESNELPDFQFTDLDGKRYSKATLKGKVLLLKCWFIHCVACVKEFPDLNKLVDDYKHFNDVAFVSLAIDSKEELKTFLAKRPFRYAVVASQENFMSEKLGITQYPTHLLINREGKIVKVTNTIEDMIPYLQKETNKQ